MENQPNKRSRRMELILNGFTIVISKKLLISSQFLLNAFNNDEFLGPIFVDIPEIITFDHSSINLHIINEYLKNDDIQISLHNKDVLYHFGKKLEINSLLEKIATFDSNLEKLSKSENIQKISECLDLFLNLTTDNFESSVERIFLMEHFEKHFDEYFFGKLFFLLFRIRPYKYSLFLDFLTRLQTQGTLDFPKILNILISKSKNKCLFIIRGLFDSGFLTIDEVRNIYKSHFHRSFLFKDIQKNKSLSNDTDLSQVLFASKFSKLTEGHNKGSFAQANAQFIKGYRNNLSQNNHVDDDSVKNELINDDNANESETNNHKKLIFNIDEKTIENQDAHHKKYCKLGIPDDELFEVLMNDDLDELQKSFSDLAFDINGHFIYIVDEHHSHSVFNYIYDKNTIYSRLNLIKGLPKYINICAYFGSKRCFDFLKINKAEITQGTMIYAIAGGSVEIIREIENDLVNFTLFEALMYAIAFHQNSVFEWLFSLFDKSELQIDTNSLLKLCVKYYNYDALLFLFSEGINVTSIIYQSFKHHSRLLFEAVINLTYMENPFTVESGFPKLAISRNQIDLFKRIMLLSQNYDKLKFQQDLNALVGYSIEKGNFEALLVLFKIDNTLCTRKIDFEISTLNLLHERCIPLTYSIILKKTRMALQILDLSFTDNKFYLNINDVSNQKFTPLHWACTNNQIEVVKSLLSRKEIEINHVNLNGDYPIHIALKKSYNEIAQMLINHHDFDFKLGINPIIIAISRNNIEIVKLLLVHPKCTITDDELSVFSL